MLQIALDTETTGLSHEGGHRIIEIGCVELIDRKITGRTFHTYINPERAVDEGAFRVHGLSQEFLQGYPCFRDIMSQFLEFISNAELIIHNAVFDIGFLNAELKRAKHAKSIADHCTVFDTLIAARQKYPGQRNTLDALCKRYAISNKHRTLHGALLDAKILSNVYLAMTGGQKALDLDDGVTKVSKDFTTEIKLNSNSPVIFATPEERVLHDEFLEKFF
jgi:DNA polymerase III subunit epsilon